MIKNLLYLLFIAFVFAQNPEKTIQDSSYYVQKDGPYIFIEDSTYTFKWIMNDKYESKVISKKELKSANIVDSLTLILQPYLKDTLNYIPDKDEYTNVKEIALLSDMHGEYDIFVKLLKYAKVIDKNENWIYSNNHLVINGDAFDRGDKVTEIFWLIYKLEKQAEIVGGKVHYLLGNHDFMCINNDLRYIHKKYKRVSELMNTSYNSLYGRNTIIGKWLRNKNVIISINNILINHAGISETIVETGLNKSQINEIFRRNLFDTNREEIKKDSLLNLFYRTNGPIWYRNYFGEKRIDEKSIDKILKYYDKEQIIVGHTSFDSVKSHYNGKVISIDSNIKLGDRGEILIIEKKNYYIITSEGKKRKLKLKN
jgi:hypothetical protein